MSEDDWYPRTSSWRDRIDPETQEVSRLLVERAERLRAQAGDEGLSIAEAVRLAAAGMPTRQRKEA